jgi:M6 family metalloprotease-like protein
MKITRKSVTGAALVSLFFFGEPVMGADNDVRGGPPGPSAISPGKQVQGAGFQESSPIRISPFAAEALARKGKKIPNLFPNADNNGTKFNPGGGLVGPLSIAPEQRLLVIFVEFSTPPWGGPETRLDLSYYDDMLFGTEYNPPEYAAYPDAPTDRTLKNYIQQVSYGKVDIVTFNMPSALGWAKIDKEYSYYCRADGIHDYGFGPFPENGQGLVIEAIKAVDPFVDFSLYARNGEVPNLLVVHAGAPAEFSGDPNLIWSHSSALAFWTGLTGYWADGVKLNRYAMMSEVGGDPSGYMFGVPLGPFPPTVGTFAHEWGHVLGIPDQYDYGNESDGTGNYSLMAGGAWGFWYPNATFEGSLMFLGNSPTHLDAWSKYRLGFIEPIKVEPGETVSVTLPPAELAPMVYRMDVPNSGGKEYYLLENRQHIGFDQSLSTITVPTRPGVVFSAGHGLAIWHIDDTILSSWCYARPNEAENWKEFRSEGWKKDALTGQSHYAISLIQADDQWDLEHFLFAAGDAGDLYPGNLGVTRFGSDTFPNSTTYYFWPGSTPRFGFSGVTVENIAESADGVITADLSFAQ